MTTDELVVALRQQAARNHRLADEAQVKAAKFRKQAAELTRKANLMAQDPFLHSAQQHMEQP